MDDPLLDISRGIQLAKQVTLHLFDDDDEDLVLRLVNGATTTQLRVALMYSGQMLRDRYLQSADGDAALAQVRFMTDAADESDVMENQLRYLQDGGL